MSLPKFGVDPAIIHRCDDCGRDFIAGAHSAIVSVDPPRSLVTCADCHAWRQARQLECDPRSKAQLLKACVA